LCLHCFHYSVSQARNYARLLIVATPVVKAAIKSTEIKSHGNNDVFIVHVINWDAQTNQQTEQTNKQMQKHKAMLGPAGCTLCTWPAGNKKDLGMACHTPPLKKAKKHTRG